MAVMIHQAKPQTKTLSIDEELTETIFSSINPVVYRKQYQGKTRKPPEMLVKRHRFPGFP